MKPLFFLITLLLGLAQFTPALGAQADQRCFAETGICISGPIRSYWESHGGLATFGLPLGQQRLETVEGRTLQVQWFERDRLEIQADRTVTAGRLGARYLERQGRPWQSFTGVALASPGCAFFDVTSHQLCEPFLTYWRTQGGLERFGYPITEVVDEQIEGRTYRVQYFERRRMEEHPELAGTPYAVLLGRLGAELALNESCVPLEPLHEPTAAAYRDLLGCPQAPSRELVGNDRLRLRQVPLVVQRFEGGTMLWVRQFAGDAVSDGEIFVITPAEGGQGLLWRRYADEWREGQPTGVTGQPPAGRYAPQRGFGYLWASNPDLRAQLGWALDPEQGETGGYRRFQYAFLLYRPSTDRYFIMRDDTGARDVPRS